MTLNFNKVKVAPFLSRVQLLLLILSLFSQGKMSRPGDWNCRSCQHLNFQRRDSCQRCGEPRPGLVTGTALLETAGPITLPAAQAVSSVEHSRTTHLEGTTVTICLVEEALGLAVLAVAVAVAVALDGNLVTGFAPGQDATNTTLLVGWSVSDAMHRGTLLASLHIDLLISIFWVLQPKERIQESPS
ncbi:hypothetical protein F0562_007198 [Nyssa sinensis]|uniref:RanBP2-type domain-containing protein n=1 Tax=Nyssa sinensis TaxID=561372 RepID=A0A5J5A5E0_9ASTE|nr:hypothetical protein F0562_007198 [Nyssa sinensis]